NLAHDAAGTVPYAPHRVVLWDPVVDGRGYLRQLSDDHAFWIRQRNVHSEALGFLLPEGLRAEIARIDLRQQLAASSQRASILIGANVDASDQLIQSLAQSRTEVPCVVSEQTTVWS